MRPSSIISVIFVWVCVTFSTSLLGDADTSLNGGISQSGKRILARGLGATSDTDLARIGTMLTTEDFIGAIYGANRANRRIALDAAGYVTEPWPLVPYLISFIEAAERQAASTAANSLSQILQRNLDIRGSHVLPIRKQTVQLTEMLSQAAQNNMLDEDLRVLAIQSIGRLQESTGKSITELEELYTSSSLAVRLAALSLAQFPLKENTLHRIASLASVDEDAAVHGTAVAMICENALSHNIFKPSDDLKELIVELFDSRKEEIALAPVLGCLARFPYRERASVTDKVTNCGSEKVIKYWKSLTE